MVFNITITKFGKIDWIGINKLCGKLDRTYVTVFPIQSNEFSKESGIGLSINMKKNYHDFWIYFKPFLIDIYKKGFTITELYNGLNINLNNISELEKLIR
jgi:hypothetical protein